MDLLEDCGLVKMDFLGLKTLTLIENTKVLIASRGDRARPRRHPGRRCGSPSRCSAAARASRSSSSRAPGMAAILKRARPGRIEDLIALNALYRPGPMENIDQFVDSKNGRMAISYPLPQLEAARGDLRSHRLPGAGHGDRPDRGGLLARAGRHPSPGDGQEEGRGDGEDAPELHRGREAAGHQRQAGRRAIFTLLEPFAGYGFNKSHAAAYSVLAYKTAYLKANYPVEFMAANLTNEINNPDTFADYMAETTRMGIEMLAPDVNLSEKYFSVADGNIVYGLVGIKNVGAAAVDAVLSPSARRNGALRELHGLRRAHRHEERQQKGDRDVHPVRPLRLARGGSMSADAGERHARAPHAQSRPRARFRRTRREARETGQVSLFEDTDEIAFTSSRPSRGPISNVCATSASTSASTSRVTRSTPTARSGRRVRRSTSARAASASPERVHRLVGLLKGVRAIYTRKGTMMAFGSWKTSTIPSSSSSSATPTSRAASCSWTRQSSEWRVRSTRAAIESNFVVEKLAPPDELPERDTGQLHLRISARARERGGALRSARLPPRQTGRLFSILARERYRRQERVRHPRIEPAHGLITTGGGRRDRAPPLRGSRLETTGGRMDIIRVIMQLLSIALSIYSFIIFVRIILTWFQDRVRPDHRRSCRPHHRPVHQLVPAGSSSCVSPGMDLLGHRRADHAVDRAQHRGQHRVRRDNLVRDDSRDRRERRRRRRVLFPDAVAHPRRHPPARDRCSARTPPRGSGSSRSDHRAARPPIVTPLARGRVVSYQTALLVFAGSISSSSSSAASWSRSWWDS